MLYDVITTGGYPKRRQVVNGLNLIASLSFVKMALVHEADGGCIDRTRSLCISQ
jgi:hypothetical protein